MTIVLAVPRLLAVLVRPGLSLRTRSAAGRLPLLAALVATLTGCAISVDPADNGAPVAAAVKPANGCDRLAVEAPQSTFVLLDPATGDWRACNPERAYRAYLPASTFKVPHALIALETGIVTDEHAMLPWDGMERRVSGWNTDTSLASGMRNSTVWVYQRMARAIGHPRMADWVERLGYGNKDIGAANQLTSFWLDGDLRISAIEQVAFLDRLRRGSLPAAKQNQARVAAMMRLNDGRHAPPSASALHAKSGVVLPIDPATGDLVSTGAVTSRFEGEERIGWFVGWLARPRSAGGDRVFAFNLTLATAADLIKRESLTRTLLAANGAEVGD